MKKAYVKPVFMAEEFVSESYFAGRCDGRYKPISFDLGTTMCDGSHVVAKLGLGENNDQSDGKKSGLALTWYQKQNGAADKVYEQGMIDENGYLTNYGYAFADGDMTIFGDMDVNCDFLWDDAGNGHDYIKVWDSAFASERQNTYTGTETAFFPEGKDGNKTTQGSLWQYFGFFGGQWVKDADHAANFLRDKVEMS